MSASKTAENIARIEAEIVTIRRTGASLEELQDESVARLRDAEAFYRTRGLPLRNNVMTPGETAAALIGFQMATNGKSCIGAERSRVEAQFNARGGNGMAADVKAKRLADLQAKLRVLHAKAEIERRAAGDEIDGAIDAECFLRTTDDLAAISEGKDAA